MQVDLTYLLEKKPEFYELTQRDQIKYLAFIFIRNNNLLQFKQSDVKNVFSDFNLGTPSHMSEEFNKLTKKANGKTPVFVKKGHSYVFHPNSERELTLELFSGVDKKEQGGIASKNINTELFSQYQLHPTVKKVAFQQFQNGFYKEAILNAFVEVINYVKEKSGHPKINKNGKDVELDGDDLMNKVFACDGDSTPVIKFNNLTSSLDRAEQRGLMYLYKGIVGIRDKKAHLNFIQNDPIRTIEYLSLASLLMRLLDENA